MEKRIHSPGLSLVFTADEIDTARKNGKLLSLDIELSRFCNLHCIYCYVPSSEKKQSDELDVSEIISIIDQAKDLGIRTINLTGGEPLLCEHYFEIVSYAHRLGISILLFTNGTLVTKKVARRLMDMRVSPCVKLDSVSPKIQDSLVGKKGIYHKIMEGINNLINVGYTTRYPVLSVNAVITERNFDEIPKFWSWARELNIIPSLTRLQPMGRAKNRTDLMVSSKKLSELYCEISKIDSKLGIVWESSMPWVHGRACRRHYIGAFINSHGKVQPCSGVPIVAGDIRDLSLGEIISNAKIFKIARNMETYIEGECKTCRYKSECYGCRSIAYAMTNSFTAADPLCWNNQCNVRERSFLNSNKLFFNSKR